MACVYPCLGALSLERLSFLSPVVYLGVGWLMSCPQVAVSTANARANPAMKLWNTTEANYEMRLSHWDIHNIHCIFISCVSAETDFFVFDRMSYAIYTYILFISYVEHVLSALFCLYSDRSILDLSAVGYVSPTAVSSLSALYPSTCLILVYRQG